MRNICCLRCNEKMSYAGTEKIQLGESGWILGNLPNLIAGAFETEIYICPECGKIEFYRLQQNNEGIASRKCPGCGNVHDYDYPKCPYCKYDYYSK